MFLNSLPGVRCPIARARHTPVVRGVGSFAFSVADSPRAEPMVPAARQPLRDSGTLRDRRPPVPLHRRRTASSPDTHASYGRKPSEVPGLGQSFRPRVRARGAERRRAGSPPSGAGDASEAHLTFAHVEQSRSRQLPIRIVEELRLASVRSPPTTTQAPRQTLAGDVCGTAAVAILGSGVPANSWPNRTSRREG